MTTVERFRTPPLWLTITISVASTLLILLLRLFVFTEHIVPIADALPLLVVLWHRDKRQLWAMATVLVAASGYKLFGLLGGPEIAFTASKESVFFSMKALDTLIAATVVHLAVNYRQSVERTNLALNESNVELQASNEELADREEEITRQNEELQVQSEEMQQQSEELQSQGEELRLINEELAARERTLETLLQLAGPTTDDATVLPGICQAVTDMLGGNAACLLEQVGEQLVVRAHAGFGASGPLAGEFALATTLAKLALERGQPAHLRDVELRADIAVPQPCDGQPIRSVLAAPVRCGGRIIGALEVYSCEPTDWTDRQASMLEWVAAQCGQAWEAMRLRSELRQLNDSLEQKVQARTALLEARTNELQLLASKLATAEHRERRRIAQVLHDELQQLLVAARMRLNAAAVPQGAWKEQIEELIGQAIDMSRSITTELSPPILFEERFEGSLNWLARRMKQQQNLDVEVTCQNGAEPPDDDWRVFLFTAVGECLFNIVKHAGVNKATVDVRVDDGTLRTVIVDGGRGFVLQDAQQRAQSGESFGLFSVRERAALLGGYVKVESKPGNGTRVEIVVPLDRQRRGDQSEEAISIAAETPATASETASDRFATPAASDRVRVLLADDHRMLREGLAGLLDGLDDLEVVGQANDGQEAVEMAESLRPDVVVMDVSMPRMNGIEATRVIGQRLPFVRVVGMSMHERDEMASAMMEAGAVAYVTKGGPSEQLISQIRRAAQTPTPTPAADGDGEIT